MDLKLFNQSIEKYEALDTIKENLKKEIEFSLRDLKLAKLNSLFVWMSSFFE